MYNEEKVGEQVVNQTQSVINQAQMILEMKANLFDFHNLFSQNGNHIDKIIKCSYDEVNRVMESTDAKFFISKQQLARLAPSKQHPSLKESISTDQYYLDYFEEQFATKDSKVLINNSIFTLNDVQYHYHIIMKLTSAANFNAYYIFVYKEEPNLTYETIDAMQLIVNKHFEILCESTHERFLQERNQLLFQLSTSLHSIYSTVDVLKRVYRSVKSLYPSFDFRFLMSHEYDDTTMPIYTMEYFDNNDLLETKAFMNNELQIDFNNELHKTMIYAPLTGRQGVYGVIEVTIPTLIELYDADIEFINQSSKMIGRAVERTTLYQSSTQLITDLKFINVATRDLNQNLEKAEISESVKKHISDSCQAEEIGIIILPNGENTSEKYIVTEESTSYFKLSGASEFVSYIYEKLQEEPEPILSGNFTVENLPVPFNSVMVIPMLDSERMFGIIIIAHEKPYYFSFDKYKFVQSFVQHAALAYTNSMLKEKLRQTAITDYLTNLYMRNYLDKKIDQHMNNGQGGSFILLDVDDFKLVNDTYGHYVGDKVLIQIANILRDSLNDNEIAARWGGEEFAVYLPYYNLEYAKEVAKTIRLQIKENTDPNVTVSMGISLWNDKRRSIEELFIEADEALYEANETGKNRIIIR